MPLVVAPLGNVHIQPGYYSDAYTGEAEHSDRPIVNAPIGDRDRSGATLAGRSAVACPPFSVRDLLARFGARCGGADRRWRQPAWAPRCDRATGPVGAGS